MAQLGSYWTDSSLIKIWQEQRILYMKTHVHVIISRSVLLTVRNVSHKICRENQNTHFVFSTFLSENRAVYDILWENEVERDRPQMTIRGVPFACWIPKATDKHSEYVILIAFLRQQWLRERASFIRSTYTAFHVHCHHHHSTNNPNSYFIHLPLF